MRRIFLICLVVWSGDQLYSQSKTTASKHYNLKKNIALQGYDPVSYFVNEPKKGAEQYRYGHHGAVYYFSSQQNLETFKKNPEQYEPQYGGWCAYAIGATGDKVKIDPGTYKIVDDKLYLFYNFRGHNTLLDWNRDEAKLKPAADENWATIIH
ncbi:MAG: YHS domain-containing protein [Cytophagales bacterium]|nr:YHS domain-containing protein [Cytophagales bacterium]